MQPQPDRTAQVALYHSTERTTAVRQALAAIIATLPWHRYERVVVKPNLVMYDRPYANTHPDTLQTVLALIRDHYCGPLTIAEGAALHATTAAFAVHGYPALAQRYDCQLLDLNGDETVAVLLPNQAKKPLTLRLARTIVESDCRISLSLPKTHDTVLVTMALKNMIMGALVNRRAAKAHTRPHWLDRLGQILLGHGNGWGSDKRAMHQSYPLINLYLAQLAPLVRPHLSILDGFVAMEGAGPVDGDPAPWGIALAGTDPLAVDVLAAHLMGFRLDEVGYLAYCAQAGLGVADLAAITVVGNTTPGAVRRSFTPHPQHQAQRQWQHPQARQLIQQRPVLSTGARDRAVA